MFSYGAGTTAITESHVYLDDDPTGTPSDNYTVILSIVDDDTGAGSATGSVTVNNVAPVVNAGPDQVVQISTPVNFNGAITDTGTLDTHEIVWDLGDGTIVTGTLTPSHLYSSEGTYIVTLTVTDDDTGVGTDTMQVVVDSPTAVTLTDLGGSSSSRPTLLYFFLLLPGVAVWLFYRRYVKA
jgi:PKD repeat protein